jgi:hypothetical protein
VKKTITPHTVIALLALAAPASAAKPVTYEGKTSSGLKVTFQVENKRIHDPTAGIRMSCVPIRAAARRPAARRRSAFAGPCRSDPTSPTASW